MATDREFSVILKATDLSTQPINQIVEALRKLTEAQKANNEAAAKGAITAKDFKDGLETAKSAAGGLAGAITVLQRVQDQMARTAKQGEALADMRAKLSAKQAETPPDAEPTEKQAAAVKRLETSVASLQKRYEQGNATLETYIATLEKMGVAADLSDKMGTRLLREREKTTQAAIAAQEKLNAKIAAAPEEGERTKAQEYSIRRLVTAMEAAQSRAQQAQVALQNYQGVKLNEAIITQQVRLREELTAVEPVIARANVETLSLTENRRKAAEAATAQTEAEKLLATQAKAAAEAEDKYNAEFAARQRTQRQAETGRFAKGGEVDTSSANAAAASELSLRNVRQSAFQDALRDQEAQTAASKSAREREIAEDAAFIARRRAEAQAASAQQIEIDRSSAAAASANELSLRNVRRSAFEEAIAEQEQRVAAEKAAHAAEDADNKAFVERQRVSNRERAEADQKLLAEQQRINDERANLRRFDFQQAVEAQAKEEALADQRAAAAKEQQQRLEQLLESQNKIARAQAAIPGTLPSGAVPQAPRDFSQSITSILAPAQAARETLAGIEKQIDAITVGMQAAKLRSEDYDKILRDLGATFGALQRQANLVDAFRQQEQAIERLLAELTKEQSTLQALNASYAKAQTYDEAQVRVILDQTNKVKGLTAAFNAQNETFSQTKAAAQAAGIDINNLAASETRITEAALKGSEVLKTANAATGRGNEFTFLGLRPYELQNLSYQINDVFTQLASGTSITQTFAQQGGQIFQLFQKQIVEFVASLRAIPFALTAIGAAFAGATVGVLAFVRAIDVAAERRHAIAQLTQNVDGTRYSVDKLLETAKGLEKLGVSLSEGMAAARELTNIGVDPERIKPLLELSANFANANNLKFADSFKQVMAAFTGSRQDLLKFVTEMHSLLTFDQFKQIRDAAEAGRMAEAQSLALSAVSDRIREAADRNSTAIVRAFHQLQAAWNSFLESVASNTVVNNFGQQMLKFLRDSVTEATKLFGILDALVHLDFTAMGKAFRGEGLPNVDPRIGTNAASVSGQRPGETAEFVALRDRVADAVGISRDAFRLLQQSESKWDARANKWSDALDKAGNVIENGGKGAAQVVTSTFEEMKKKYPDLIKGDIHDVTSNLMAGALYFREMAQQGSNVFGKAVEAYKQGPRVAFGSPAAREKALAGISPESAAANTSSIRALSGQFTGPVIVRTGAPQTLESVPAVTPGGPLGDPAQIALDTFRRSEAELRQVREEAYATEQRRYEIFAENLKKSDKEVADRLQETLKGRDVNAEDRDRTLAAEQSAARLQLWQDYQRGKLERAQQTQAKLDEIEQQALQGDKTNYEARLRLSEAAFERRRKDLERENAAGRFPTGGGQTYQQALDLLNASQQQAQANILIDAAKAIVENVTARREAELKEVRARLNVPGANPAEIAAAATTVVAKFAPLVIKAVDDANKTLERARPLASGEQTEAVRRAQAENALTRAQATRPESIGPLLQQATTGAETPVTAAVEQQAAQLAVITDSVKVAGVSAADAIGRITEFGKTSLASLRDLVATQRTQLEVILAQPNTSDADKARLRTLIEQNALAPSKLAVELGVALQAAIAEDKQKLDKLLEEYKKATTDLDAKIRDGRLAPLAAAAERARIDQRLIPQISAAGRQVQQDVAKGQEAAGQLGLSPGFRAGLAAEGQDAATRSNQQTLTSASVRDAAQRTLTQGKTELATMNETIRTQQELLKAGATTQTEAENATKEAHEAAMKAVKSLEPEIQKNIDALNEMGDNQGAKKLTADFKLLQTQVAYVDPLIQEITTGLENSFATRGEQAIKSVAQAFGKVITGQEKFKDLLGDTGRAFANFTAGILEDVASIIIKYTLLKAIKDALGVGPGGGAASGAGGWLASLFGSGAGAAGAAAGTFGTTAASAGSISAETFLGAASTGAIILHGGGIVGSSGMSRVVDLSVFREAQRFHNGGMVLSRDEIPIIAQRGEKIVSLAQQRTDAAQKAAQAAQTAQNGASIRNVLAVGDKEIASAMNSSHGERVVLNVLQRNAPTVKKWVG